ncbi:MAG: glycosyltransferase [Pseudomonadota bacterium]|nr:glycosyltransferase [Pseudomonadota bacterium]
MKILQAIAGADYGGAEAFFSRISVAFQRAGLSQRVVMRRHADRERVLSAAGIAPVPLTFGGKLDISTRLALKRQIKDFQPDIVLSWMNRATSFCPKGDFIHVGRLGGYYNVKYYRNCDHLIANTSEIADYLVNSGWDQEKVHYLPNFVGGGRAEPVKRDQLYTPATAPVILALGRLHENKAFEVLLKAVARVPNVYLWIAGEGPLRKQLEEEAEVLGIKPRVRFLGWRDDVEALFAAADIFVCPSRYEPLGNVVIEAWAQGVPVIAADSIGPGTLINQGSNGILFPVDDFVSLAKHIKRLVSDGELRDIMVENGYAFYEAEFTEDIVVDKYVKFFEQLVN